MEEHVIVDASFSAEINLPFDSIDIPAWCFSLPDDEYQACSPAHVAAGATIARDGRRMSINVEVIGGTIMVQHYVEELSEKHHLILESISDLFTTAGRTKIFVMWELSVKPSNGNQCVFTCHVKTRATDELWDLLARQGIPFDVFTAQRQPMSFAHIKAETPLFAASIERYARRLAAAA